MGQMKDGNLFVIFPASAICKCPSAPVTPGADRGAWEKKMKTDFAETTYFFPFGIRM